jgi:hypothetical protein
MEQTMKQVKVDTNRLWLSNKEAMKYLGVSKDWLDNRRADGTLHYSKVGNTIFYIKKEIDDMIRAGAVSGKGLFRTA